MTLTTYELSAEDLQHLKDWAFKIPYLPLQKMEDHIFIAMYKASKGNLERTKKAICKFSDARLRYPQIMKDLSPLEPAIQDDYDAGSFVVPLPYKTEDGCTILVGRIGRTKKNYYNPYNRIRDYGLTLMCLMNDNKIESGKLVVIQDLKNVTFTHMSGITPKFLYEALSFFVTSFPYRIQAVHAVSMPTMAEWGAALLKSALKKKLAARIHINHKPEELLKYYSKDILPSDLGGHLDSTQTLFREHRQMLEKRADEYAEFEKLLKKCDALRPTKKKGNKYTGSFRNLEVD